MSKKPILIGEAPSRRSDVDAVRRSLKCPPDVRARFVEEFLEKTALCMDGGERIANVSGLLDWEDYLTSFERRNLLARWPGRDGKGSAFPLEKARPLAMGTLSYIHRRDVIFVGRRVAAAYFIEQPYLEWRPHVFHAEGNVDSVLASFRAAILPHPSRINRWWNDPENERRARTFLRRAADLEVH